MLRVQWSAINGALFKYFLSSSVSTTFRVCSHYLLFVICHPERSRRALFVIRHPELSRRTLFVFHLIRLRHLLLKEKDQNSILEDRKVDFGYSLFVIHYSLFVILSEVEGHYSLFTTPIPNPYLLTPLLFQSFPP